MNGAARTDAAKLVVEGHSFTASETIRGQLELAYFPGIDHQNYKLRFRCFTTGEVAKSETSKPGVLRTAQRRFTENKPSARGLAKVSPMFNIDTRDKDRDAYPPIVQVSKPSPVKKKLNRISFVSKETTGEDDMLMSQIKSRGTLPLQDILQTAIVDQEIDLSEGIHAFLQISSRDTVRVNFEIELNSKVPASIDRPLNLTANVSFDNKREEMIQRTVYKRAKTLVESKNSFDKSTIDEKRPKEKFSVISMIEIYRNGILIDSKEVKIYNESSILAKDEVHVLTGSIQRLVKYFFCCRKLSHLSYIFCLNNNKIIETKKTLTFKFKAQFGVLGYFQYLDFKIKERLENGESCYGTKTIYGYSVYLAKKTHKDQLKKDTEYFEFVGTISLADFKVADHCSFNSPNLKIRHSLKVYLSNWPYTFTNPVGEVDLTISQSANPQDFLDLMTANFSFMNFAEIDPISLSL